MSDLKLFPDLILASPAKRTAQTAELLARELHYSAEQIEYQEKLYHGSPSVLLDIIISLPAHVNLVFIVAHNPGLTEFANQLIPNFYVDNMPTCSFVAANVENGGWEDFANANVKLLLFETPKKL